MCRAPAIPRQSYAAPPLNDIDASSSALLLTSFEIDWIRLTPVDGIHRTLTILDGLSRYVFPRGAIAASSISHFLIVAAPSGKLTVYVDELEIKSRIQSQSTIQPGGLVWSTD